MRIRAAAAALASITLLLIAATPAVAVEYYRSNSVGIQGPVLDTGAAEQPEYILEVSSSGGTETRLLRRDGAEIQRTEIARDGQTETARVYESGRLQSETVRSDLGLVMAESFYNNGELTERSEYSYNADRLVFRSVLGSGGGELFTERYSYWGDGSLRTVVKEDRAATRTEYRYRNGRLEEEWVSRPGEAERFEFDSAGRLVIRELFSGDELTEQEVRLYWGADAGSLLRQVIVSAGETVTTRDYDDRGRLVREQVEETDVVVRELVRTFTGDLLTGETEVDSEGERSWDYTYDEEGERTSEIYREDGELIEVAHLRLEPSEAPADRMTELFNRGEAVLRIYYEGQTRLREDVIRNGEVIRTRDFSAAARDGDQ